ncbi:hypothetical protein HKBW3S06_01407, partial [Candidatus Hakubella thermalkaliphila]
FTYHVLRNRLLMILRGGVAFLGVQILA